MRAATRIDETKSKWRVLPFSLSLSFSLSTRAKVGRLVEEGATKAR